MKSCRHQQTLWNRRSKNLISAGVASLKQWNISSVIATWLWTDRSGDTTIMDVHCKTMMMSVVPVVWMEPKLQCTDSSTHRSGYGGSLFYTYVLSGLAFGVQLVQLLFLEGPDPWHWALPPSNVVGSESFPASYRNVAGMHGMLEGVFVLLAWTSLFPWASD